MMAMSISPLPVFAGCQVGLFYSVAPQDATLTTDCESLHATHNRAFIGSVFMLGFRRFPEELIERTMRVFLAMILVLAILVDRMRMRAQSIVVNNVVFIATRYLVAHMRHSRQVVRMLFCRSVGMLGMERTIAVVVNAVHARSFAGHVFLQRRLSFVRLRCIFSFLALAHLAQTIESITRH
jgi:hypothetical protein